MPDCSIISLSRHGSEERPCTSKTFLLQDSWKRQAQAELPGAQDMAKDPSSIPISGYPPPPSYGSRYIYLTNPYPQDMLSLHRGERFQGRRAEAGQRRTPRLPGVR